MMKEDDVAEAISPEQGNKLWLALASSPSRGLGTVLVVLALPALVAGCVALSQRARSAAA